MSYTAFLSRLWFVYFHRCVSRVHTRVLHLLPVWVINCWKMEVILQSYSLRSHMIYGDGKTKAFFLKEPHHHQQNHYWSGNFGLDPKYCMHWNEVNVVLEKQTNFEDFVSSSRVKSRSLSWPSEGTTLKKTWRNTTTTSLTWGSSWSAVMLQWRRCKLYKCFV